MRTTGVNWESVGVIVALVALIFTLVTYFTNRREDKQQRRDEALRADFTKAIGDMRTDLTESIDHLAEVMTARLESKDTVSKLTERVRAIEVKTGTNP